MLMHGLHHHAWSDVPLLYRVASGFCKGLWIGIGCIPYYEGIGQTGLPHSSHGLSNESAYKPLARPLLSRCLHDRHCKLIFYWWIQVCRVIGLVFHGFSNGAYDCLPYHQASFPFWLLIGPCWPIVLWNTSSTYCWALTASCCGACHPLEYPSHTGAGHQPVHIDGGLCHDK